MRYSSQIILMCFASSLKAQVKQTNFPGVNKNNVYSITRFQNTVFVGGAFDTIGNVARNHLAAVDANTGAVLSWNPNADGEIKKMLVASNKLIVAGEFYNISGALREHIAVYDLPSLNLLSSNITNTGSYIEALCVEGNFVYYNASFFNSFYTNGVARFDINTLQTDNSWSIDSVDGPGQLVVVAFLINYFFVVGHFD